MDCFTDTSCLTNVFDAMHQLAATIDFYGLVLFGDVWSPIAPGIEAQTEWLATTVNEMLTDGPARCAQYAMLETTRA